MLGGVAQWMADCWFPNYRGAPADASAREAQGCEKRVLRGGSFRVGRDEITVDLPQQLRCSGALSGQRLPGGADASLRHP